MDERAAGREGAATMSGTGDPYRAQAEALVARWPALHQSHAYMIPMIEDALRAAAEQAASEERREIEGMVASRTTSMRLAMESTSKGTARDCYQCAFNELASAQQAIHDRHRRDPERHE